MVGMLLAIAGGFADPAFAHNDYSPLGFAARTDNASEVLRLLAAGTPIDQKSGIYNETPLMIAADRGRLALVTLLLDKGAVIDESSPFAGTALHSAAFHGRLAVCRTLLERGANVNARNEEGWTPLHQVVNGAPDYQRLRGEYLEVAQLLVSKGADLNAKTRGGLTPLDMAKNRMTGERRRIAEFLRTKGTPSK